jgi:hypothetical protein
MGLHHTRRLSVFTPGPGEKHIKTNTSKLLKHPNSTSHHGHMGTGVPLTYGNGACTFFTLSAFGALDLTPFPVMRGSLTLRANFACIVTA